MHYFVSILVLQSSWKGRERLLLCFVDSVSDFFLIERRYMILYITLYEKEKNMNMNYNYLTTIFRSIMTQNKCISGIIYNFSV